jgi:ABC-type polysaccharide/polyol phosphate export permease
MQRAFPALQAAANFAILIGGALVAVQIRMKIPWGLALGAEYDPQPLVFFAILFGALCLAYGVAYAVAPVSNVLSPGRQFRVLVVAIVLSVLGALAFVPDLSGLQLLYFAAASLVLGVLTVVWPGRLARGREGQFFFSLARLWQGRFLLLLWLRFNIQSRYSQTILGVLWIILLPLSVSLVLTLAFSQFLQIQLDVPFVVFFLSALVPWGLFAQGVQNSAGALTSRMSLLNQVYFPREILLLLTIGEALVDFFFIFLALLLVSALNGIWPNLNYIYLPFLLFILVCFTAGAMFFVGCLGVLVRDIPQLIGIVLQLAFYITPILYAIERIPDQFRVLALLNPLASVIQGFRDVIVYARPPDLLTLYYPAVFALALLYTGYAFFKANEERLTDFS